MKYEATVAHNLKGCDAVSTGINGKCSQCFDTHGGRHFAVYDIDVPIPIRCQHCAVSMQVEADTMPTVSGHCRNCGEAIDPVRLASLDKPDYVTRWTYGSDTGEEYETEELAEHAAREEFENEVELGIITSEGGFYRGPCDICDTHLGGNYEPWHYIDAGGALQHGDHACTDCVQYLANGTIPDIDPNDDDDETHDD